MDLTAATTQEIVDELAKREVVKGVNEKRFALIKQAVEAEFRKTSGKFPAFNSGHEGFAVLKEEVDELWEAVKLNQQRHPERDDLMLKEGIRVAAMGLRFLHDVAFKNRGRLE